MTQPAVLPMVFATDENVAVRAGDDYLALALPSNLLASGTDGVFSGSPDLWIMTSATVDFQANGVVSQSVVSLTKGTPKFPGSGQLLAIDAVAGGSVTLRRLGQPLRFGQPPGVGSPTGVTFTILTFGPQIEEVSYDLCQQYGIDQSIPTRGPSWIYNPDHSPTPRILRRLCVLMVLYDRLTVAVRSSEGDWSQKLKQVKGELDDLLDRTSVRWGPYGNSSPPVGRYSTRLSR